MIANKFYLILCLFVLVGSVFGGGISLSVNDFSADNNCLIKSELEAKYGLDITRDFIYGPGEGQDRKQWLELLKKYRENVLAGEIGDVFEFNFDGVRSWTRLDIELSKLCGLVPGQKFKISMEAKCLGGSNIIYVAFDVHRKTDDAKVGWLRMKNSGVEVPADGKWHEVSRVFEVLRYDSSKGWLRPIIGMDGFFDKNRGEIQISDIKIDLLDPHLNKRLGRAVERKKFNAMDVSIYDMEDLQWQNRNFACHFSFMYDSSFYDNKTGYKIDSFLDDGQDEFGGYDSILLWQAYPRIGVDERNQFDFYRDMPGGLEALRKLVEKAHARGVKVFIDYNPWDIGTRRESKSDEDMLVEMLKEIGADGIFLDTMTEAKMSLRAECDKFDRGISLVPECNIAINQLPYCSGSWAQYFQDKNPPGLLQLKWLEPRHMQYQIKRWEMSHQSEIQLAFFNGSGMKIWENVFGTFMPWSVEDRRDWKLAVGVLRCFSDIFTSKNWEPFYPTETDKVFANKWYGDGMAIFTLLNYSGKNLRNRPLVEIPDGRNMLYYDLWRGQAIKPWKLGGSVQIASELDGMGCVLMIEESKMNDKIRKLIARQAEIYSKILPEEDKRQRRKDIMYAEEVERTAGVGVDSNPYGMVYVPGQKFTMKIEHRRRECGCYPDPGTAEGDRFKDYIMGHPWSGKISHEIGPVNVRPFFIDETLVTNEQYKRFLFESGYEPKFKKNFLKHWEKGRMPKELANHPVVYVDIDDARAYAKWAGKRLATEVEWQLAAQGDDERKWPWGDDFDPNKCNGNSTGTTEVRNYPEGRSAYGCYDMSGNVWEWTESCRDDGHSRFVMIRGGSYFDAKGSDWYVKGGARPCGSHTKFILMYPGLDRCATIGFRCVADVKTE